MVSSESGGAPTRGSNAEAPQAEQGLGPARPPAPAAGPLPPEVILPLGRGQRPPSRSLELVQCGLQDANSQTQNRVQGPGAGVGAAPAHA